MLLSEFLNYFDFDYKVVNGQICLIDLQGANLGNIEEDRFELSESGLASVVDRLDIYIKDYVFDDLQEQLSAVGVEGIEKMDLGVMAKIAREKDVSCAFNVIDVILNPSSLELEKDKIIESFSVGQMFYENDTEKFIVLENVCKENKDIWNFGVYDKEMNYLYDTTAIDGRLALDIINGAIKSVTSDKVLRIEPDHVLAWNGEFSATLEDNGKLWERFNDCHDPNDGDLRYVTVDYNLQADRMIFKLHFEKVDLNECNVSRNILELPAEPDEKTALLKEMKAIKPVFFDNFEKAKIQEVISAAEVLKKNGVVVEQYNVKRDGIER